MSDVTDDELLALARQVWGECVGRLSFLSNDTAEVQTKSTAAVLSKWRDMLLLHLEHPRPREALHAALVALVELGEG